MTIDQALSYIHSVDWKGSVLGLERISELLALMGNPEEKMNIIHVAGTNGKGSVCAMLTSIFVEAGLNVGTYISPGITCFNERIQYNGNNIPDEDFAEMTEYVKSFADRMTDAPTEFELFNAIAIAYFQRKKCSVVILEVGLGGSIDSTNSIKTPLLSIITSIALDHTRELGDTVEKIALAKAGIIKPGRACLFGGNDSRAETVIREAAERNASPFFVLDRDEIHVKRYGIDGTVFDFCGYENVFLPLLGTYQPVNAAIVLSALDYLSSAGLTVPEKAVLAGIARTRWPARFERLCDKPVIIYDGAHNPHGVRAAAESIRLYFENKRVYLAMGVLADKDYTKMAMELAGVCERVFTFTPKNPRALSGENLAEVYIGLGRAAESFPSAADAVGAAYRATVSDSDGVLVILGSLYIYPEVKAAVEKLTDK